MKKIYFITMLVATFSMQNSFAQNSTIQNQLSELVNSYYGIKNALVAGDATTAAKQSAEFSVSIAAVDAKVLTPDVQAVFKEVQTRLAESSKFITGLKDIAKQREVFASFSLDMISLAKAAKLSGQPIYIDYCPMKKSYWLSSEQPIKNPYYGNSMLTCGKVTETLN